MLPSQQLQQVLEAGTSAYSEIRRQQARLVTPANQGVPEPRQGPTHLNDPKLKRYMPFSSFFFT